MKSKTLIIDTETTGLLLPSTAPLEKQPRIIELAILAVEECGTIKTEYEWLINPEMDISAEITKITGIKNEDLIDEPTFEDLLPEIWLVFNSANTIIAHNAPFDIGMLESDLRRISALDGFPMPDRQICTVNEYFHEFGHRPKLTELYERKMGMKLAQTHRAMDDVLALYEVLKKDGFFELLELA